MKKALEAHNMKETLKYSREVAQLLSTDINTKDYFAIFLLVFDELSWL